MGRTGRESMVNNSMSHSMSDGINLTVPAKGSVEPIPTVRNASGATTTPNTASLRHPEDANASIISATSMDDDQGLHHDYNDSYSESDGEEDSPNRRDRRESQYRYPRSPSHGAPGTSVRQQ